MAHYKPEYPERVMATLRRHGDQPYGHLQRLTGIPYGSLPAVLRRLIGEGEIHLVTLTKAGRFYRLGCSPSNAEVYQRDWHVDDSLSGPNGGRLIRFGDRYPTNHAQRPAPRGLSGGSSLNLMLMEA